MSKLFTVIMGICVAASSAYAQNATKKQTPDSLKKDLKEVTVEANNIVTTPDKMMVFVDKNVKKHSYDGYSALSLLHVPGLDVDPIDGKISANTGGVFLCINGIEATHNDIKTLNPKDIIRIDYYTNFDPRHPDKKNVLDYIVKIRDYGGTVMLQPTQSLNLATGVDMVDWKMYKKKSEFGVNVTYNYLHFKQNTGNWSRRVMEFDRGDLTRFSQSLPTRNHQNAYNTTLTYHHRFKNSSLKAAIYCAPTHSSGNGAKEDTYEGLINREDKSVDDNHRDEVTTGFKIQYDHSLKNGGYFYAGLGGSYYNANINRDYYGIRDNIFAYTKAHGASINPYAQISLPMGKIFTPYVQTTYFYTHTNSTYFENGGSTPNRYTYQSPTISLGTNMKIRQNLSASLRLSERMSIEDYGTGDRHTQYDFIPGMDISYDNGKTGNIYFSASMSTSNPSSGYVTTVERRKDDFLITAGNPDLKISTNYNLVLSYMLHRKWGWVQIYSDYSNTSKAIYADYICDNEREVFVQSYKNGGNYEVFLFNLGFNYKLIPNQMNISAGVTYRHRKARTYHLQELDNVTGMVSIDYFNKGFVGQLKLGSPTKSLTQFGERTKKPASLDLTLGYNIDNWSFNFITRNPLMKTYSEVILNQPGFSKMGRSYNPKLSYDYYAVRITYRFNYGKPHRYQNVGVDRHGYNVGE